MTENTNEEEFNTKVKKIFITNSIFGQKLVYGLSQDKKKEVNIDYFLNHLKHFNHQKQENWEKRINFDKYLDSIPQNIHDKLRDDTDIIIKNRSCIEPYCKKQIKIITPANLFKKNGFHYKLLKLESTYYDLLGFFYNNDEVIGYVCCGKKTSYTYKNLFIVISQNYDKDFFEKSAKKLSIISEISEDIAFYEKECYNKYIKTLRNQIYSFVLEIIAENKNIKNIVCIGEELGGNMLQLFLVDFVNNKNEVAMKFNEDFSYYLFTYNTAMLSTETFYNDLINYLGGANNSMITCFDDKNCFYSTWEIDEAKRNKYNVIVLKADSL